MDGLGQDVNAALLAEQVQGGEHRDGVGLLYLSGKLADHLAVFYGGELPVYHRQPSGPLQHSHAQGVVEGCSCLSRLVLEEVENGAFLCLPQKDGYAFFDNAGFLRRYLLLRISQELRMIQTDIRDDTQDRSDNVRTVQTTAKPDLDNRVIYLLVAEILKSHTGRQLEERRMERLEERTMTLDEIDHVILGDLFPVHPDALPEVH